MRVGDDDAGATDVGTVETIDVPNAWRGLGALTAGQLLDHYRIGERIGSGGMGEVYRAVDETLQRPVALKVMRPSKEQDRLLAEAQATAKLTHPNVVVVHEAGVVDGRVFIAMEYVEGSTLRTWLTPERTWREIVAIYLAAGRGLIALHDAGLVHRDFKPENVLVGADGRPRVADLGLAARASEQPELLGGTPRYMAPEQRAGVVDARSDQFAFSVALWEALAGTPPFDPDGKRIPPERIFPGWIRVALERGMRENPEERWPSLGALLAALEHDPRVRRNRRIAAAIGVVVLGIVVAAAFQLRGADAGDACDAVADRATRAWTPVDAALVRTRFVATERSHALATADLVRDRLDRYVAGWRDQRREVCMASARKEQTDHTAELRIRCLDRLVDQMRALTTVFERDADANIVDRAVGASAQLAPLEDCASNAALADIPPPTPTQQAQVAELRAAHDAVVAAFRAGRFQQTLGDARDQAKRARALGYAPTLAETLGTLASLEAELHDDAAAEQDFTDAITSAGEAHDDAVASTAWYGLVALAVRHQRFPTASERLTFARAAAARSGAAHTVDLDQSEAELLYARGEYPGALVKIDGVLDRVAHPGLSAEDRASALGQRARILTKLHRDVESLAALREVVAVYEAALGRDHPRVAKALASTGLAELSIKRFADAQSDLDRALALTESIYGVDSLDVANVLVHRCNARIGLAKFDAAKADCERSYAIRSQLLPPDSVDLAPTLAALAKVAEMRDDHETNRKLRERMLAIHIHAYGEHHPDVVQDLMELGNVVKYAHDHTGALRYFERAYAIAQTLDDQTELADAIVNLANIHGDLGHIQQAQALVDKALALHEALDKAHPTPFSAFNVGIDHKMKASIASNAHDNVTAERELRLAVSLIEPNVGPNKSDLVDTLGSLCIVLMDQSKFKDGLEVARHALALAEAEDDKGVFRGTLNLLIAEASWEVGDHAGALAAAKAAQTIYGKLQKSPEVKANLEELEDWTKTHH